MRAESSTPAMPHTRFLGEAGDLGALIDHGVERVRDDDHERVRAVRLEVLRHAAHDLQVDRQRSSRDIPGLRGTPAVTITTSPAQSA